MSEFKIQNPTVDMMFNTETIDQWFIERHGKFTASEISVLLSGGTGVKIFSPGAMSYIRRKAVESMTVLWEKPNLDEVKSLLHGKIYEEPAYEMYKKATRNWSMRYFGTYNPVYLPYNNDSGGSPDGLMGEGEQIELGLELKCAINSSIHFDYLGFKNQWDLKEYSISYYAQMQFLMMITLAPEFHFCSFDDRFKNPNLKIKILEVKKDDKFCNMLDVRLAMAIKEKYKIIQMYESSK